ncbi:hypothetical protein JCM8547_006237, partial [Rhodosporidiobolus lusitaniae]
MASPALPSPSSDKRSFEATPPTNLTSSSGDSTTSTTVDTQDATLKGEKKSLRFWLIFAAIMAATFLSALDLTAVSTALPQIANDFDTADYSWVGTAYALTSTALIPW